MCIDIVFQSRQPLLEVNPDLDLTYFKNILTVRVIVFKMISVLPAS